LQNKVIVDFHSRSGKTANAVGSTALDEFRAKLQRKREARTLEVEKKPGTSKRKAETMALLRLSADVALSRR